MAGIEHYPDSLQILMTGLLPICFAGIIFIFLNFVSYRISRLVNLSGKKNKILLNVYLFILNVCVALIFYYIIYQTLYFIFLKLRGYIVREFYFAPVVYGNYTEILFSFAVIALLFFGLLTILGHQIIIRMNLLTHKLRLMMHIYFLILNLCAVLVVYFLLSNDVVYY